MGWATYVNNDIQFNKETYNSKFEVDNKIEECEDSIKNVKQNLAIMIAMNPKDLIQVDYEENAFDIVDSIRNRTNDLLEQYETMLINSYKYKQLLEYWHKRNGDFIKYDSYYKYIGCEPLIFTPNNVYGVNTYKDWNDKLWYYVCNNSRGEFYKLSQEEIDKYFEQISEEEIKTIFNYVK